MRPYWDYSDVICDKIFSESRYKKFEVTQNNAALGLTGVIQGTITDKTY